MTTTTQSSLDSFFGVPKEKRVSKQAKLNFGTAAKDEAKNNNKSFIASSSSSSTPVVDPPAATKKEGAAKEKENFSNDELRDTDEEDESPLAASKGLGSVIGKRLSNTNAESSKAEADVKRRRVIDDDDNDDGSMDEDEQEDKDAEYKDEDEVAMKEDEEPLVDEESEPPAKETAPELSVKQALKPRSDSVKPMKKSKGPSRKSEVVAKGMKTDEVLLEADKTPWEGNLPYSVVCVMFEQVAAITGRLEIQQFVTELFRTTLLRNPKDMYELVYLVSNSVAPAYDCIELGIGDSILEKAIGQAYGTNPGIIQQKYKAEGDLGDVAQRSKATQRTLGFGIKPKPLLARDVLTAFREIAAMSGNQSQKFKIEKIKKLLVRAHGPEVKYIIRGLQGKLRIGVSEQSVLVSLAHAAALTVPEGVSNETAVAEDAPDEAKEYCDTSTPLDKRLELAASIIKKAYSEVSSYDTVLDALLRVPLQQMYRECTLMPGRPVAPMLAKPTKSIKEVLERLNGLRFTCEYKYDGERAQVHMASDGTTNVYSRSLLDTTSKYPEVPLYTKEACLDSSTSSFVLDSEVVAYNRETKQFVPFQVLSTRKKTEESDETAKVQVIVQAFDLMYLNGASLLNKTLSERRELLREHFKPVDGKFQFAESLDHKEDGDTTMLEDFLDVAVKNQCEGLMVKTLDVNAAYEPSRRSLNWLKLKKDYLDGIGDSVDLVPLGAYYGRGKRAGVYGAYLLACYDHESEEYQSVCKIGTGFSEEDLKSLTVAFKDHIIPNKSSQYITSETLDCDVWFDAVQVWEVKAADLSKSSAHKGALGRVGEADRGIGLRFPRFERVRDDKRPDQATSSEQILEMYYQQDSIVAGNQGNDSDEDGI